MRLASALTLALLSTTLSGLSPAQQSGNLRLPSDGTRRRCEPRTSAWNAGQRALDALHERIAALRDHEPVGPVLDQLTAVLAADCFRFARESPRMPAPDSALSLKTWWEDGGFAWLSSYLELPELGLTTDLKQHVVLPPDTRRTLRTSTTPPHLAGLVCALDDPTCAADTSGWRIRAESFLSLHHAREQARERDDAPQDAALLEARNCVERAKRAPAEGQYTSWRDCLESQRPTRWMLPLGRLRAPSSGWLIVWGRRGHYSFCEAIGAYHLGTGAAYIAESCSDLVLQEGGDVDRRATQRAARFRTSTGTLRLDNLRETAWALLMLKEAEEVQASAEYHALPSGMTPLHAAEKSDGARSWSIGGWMTTAQTTLEWSWAPETGPAATGTLTWPNSSNAVEEHAAGLLDVAEKTLLEGCAPSPPPPHDLVRRRIRVNPGDAVPGIDRQLVERFRTWPPTPPCHSAHR